jgi:acyl-CoA thioesterase FadM
LDRRLTVVEASQRAHDPAAVPRLFEADYRVRFDEADTHGWLRPSGFLRYAQDMAWRHSELAGFGREWYAERSMQWLVRNVALHIKTPVTYGDTLTVRTSVTGWRHVWARRHAEMQRTATADGPADGALVAVVDTDWVLLTIDGQPARVPAEIVTSFSPGRTFVRSRVTLSEAPPDATLLSTRVRSLDVDPMGHMNNAAYLDVVEDATARLPASLRLLDADCYRVGYVRPALPGAAIKAACWLTDEGSVACRISDGEGVELTRVLVSWAREELQRDELRPGRRRYRPAPGRSAPDRRREGDAATSR